MTKIAVLGAGQVGTTLGAVLLKNGHSVKYGSRDPTSEKIKVVLAEHDGATADTIAAAAAWAEVVIVTTPSNPTVEGYQTFADVIRDAVKGKLVMDVTDPFTARPQLEWQWWDKGTSGGETLQAALPDAYVIKAFNTVGVGLMQHGDGSTIPGWTGGALSLLIAGAAEKRAEAEAIVREFGWKPAYVGPIRYARNLEAMAELWVALSHPKAGMTDVHWGWHFHFEPVGANLS